MSPTEQELARHLLAQRENGYSIAYVLRRTKVLYVIHIAAIIGFLVVFNILDDLWFKGLCLWAVGMFSGAICRDFGWLRRIKKTWPFSQKITDWQKVEAIAEGREPANLPVNEARP